MNMIMLGPPGAGKGTQAKRLEAARGLPHINSGDIFRDIRRDHSPLALEVQQYMDRGEYVPDDLTIEVVLRRLSQPDAANGFILDGFPRTIAQAEALDHALRETGMLLDLVLYITAPDEIVRERLEGRIICPQCHAIYNVRSNPARHGNQCDVCGHDLERRTDETPEIIGTRLATYVRQTRPLVDYYCRQGLVVEIDGSRPLAEVTSLVDAAVDEKGKAA